MRCKSRLPNPLELLEEARKSWDYLISDEIVYFAEPRYRKYPREYVGYIKDYIEGRLWFEFVASRDINQKQKLVWLIDACPTELPITCKAIGNLPTNWRDNPMLVLVHKFLKDTKKFCFWSIPSVVRLKIINNVPSITREEPNVAFEQTNTSSVWRMRPMHAYREADPLRFIRLEGDVQFFASLDSECPCNMVKRGTQVTKNIPSNLTPRQSYRRVNSQGIDIRHIKYWVSSTIRNVQLALSDEGDFWIARGTTNRQIKTVDVLIRPLNLELGAIKWMHPTSSTGEEV